MAGLLAAAAFAPAAQAEKYTLHGASQFDESHAFTRLMRKFKDVPIRVMGAPIQTQL